MRFKVVLFLFLIGVLCFGDTAHAQKYNNQISIMFPRAFRSGSTPFFLVGARYRYRHFEVAATRSNPVNGRGSTTASAAGVIRFRDGKIFSPKVGLGLGFINTLLYFNNLGVELQFGHFGVRFDNDLFITTVSVRLRTRHTVAAFYTF